MVGEVFSDGLSQEEAEWCLACGENKEVKSERDFQKKMTLLNIKAGSLLWLIVIFYFIILTNKTTYQLK